MASPPNKENTYIVVILGLVLIGLPVIWIAINL